MAKYKYYKGYYHDLESNYYEAVSNEYYIIPKNAKTYTDEDGNEKFEDNTKFKFIPNNRKGEVLIYRVGPKGKRDKGGIIAPYCDFQEHFRERIKASKGYLKRVKERKRRDNVK